MKREVPKRNQRLMTREVMSRGRRFFFDVEQGERGRYLKISELELDSKKDEKGYTIIVYQHEIKGFAKALNDALRTLEKP